ncbi:hypothetical protein FDO65_07000 [Nakamurella flava]|uniref:Uncharacterized protein n=1 Tax=Nakamurella flava TaxID=2576308 RepID=A0A4U6QLZ6_9ACTN|nr:AAA family ATPase [Nakamurella flava]TKV61339.1 hypothetical protein FDO65_07000 [Nakamurella flava]
MSAPIQLPTPQRGISHRVLDRSALADLPTPSPLIARTIDLGTVGVVAGYWGTLKSFIGLSWASSAATGFAWDGRAVEPCRVLYVAAEGAYGLHQRLSAWEQHRRTVIPSAEFLTLPEPVNLGSEDSVNQVIEFVASERIRFAWFDTLAKCMPGMDENSSRDMGVAVSSLYRIRAATGDGAVAAIHHTGKDKTTIRGSSALEAGVDWVYKTEGDANGIQLSRTKRKDGPVEDVHRLAFQAVDGTDSGVVVQSQEGLGLRPNADELLSHFQSHFSLTGATPTQLFEVSDMPKSSFYRALSELVSAGVIQNHGTDKRAFYKEASHG